MTENKKSTNLEISEPGIILVEGKNDERFIGAFIKGMNIDKIQLISVGSKDKFSKGLKSILPFIDKIKCIGIMRDAEEDPQKAIQSIQSILKNNNLPYPSRPLEISRDIDKPAIIFLVVPPDKSGSLETLCLDSLAQDEVMRCVSLYTECLKNHNIEIDKFTKAKLDKLKLQVLLASKEPEKRLGEAAEAGLLPLGSESFECIREFLRKVRSCFP